ncbi:MAG TPA: divalent metal cation transporter, partial [Xanthomonadales bacterium]|nr:divalent metal cation transporter [Xanthomonadales bacterium]
VHIFVAMGQFSIMTSACLSLFGLHPPQADSLPGKVDDYFKAELSVSVLLGCAILWLVLYSGYNWMQKVMTTLLILMLLCFLALAIRSFGDAGAILAGLVPNIPEDLPVPGSDTIRLSSSTLIAIVGSAIAPGGLLAIPYLSSDARKGQLDLKQDFRKCLINFGFIFGAYSVFILIAGGYALHPLPNHAEIETVHEAGQVLNSALFPGARSLGPMIFSVGLFIAAMTTMIVCVQIVIYTSLDMLRKPWSYSPDNRLYRRLLIVITVFVSIVAPLWSFPAMLKVLLLMGVNVLVLPIIIGALLYLVNQRSVMGEHTATLGRNVILVGCVALSVLLAVANGPDLLQMLASRGG